MTKKQDVTVLIPFPRATSNSLAVCTNAQVESESMNRCSAHFCSCCVSSIYHKGAAGFPISDLSRAMDYSIDVGAGLRDIDQGASV